MTNSKKAVTNCLSLINQIKDQHEALDLQSQRTGFDKYIALIGSVMTPLTAMELFSLEKSMTVFVNHCNDMSTVLGVRQCQNLSQLFHFFKQFSQKDNSVVSRSFLMHTTFVDDYVFGKFKISEWIEKHIESETPSITDKHLQEMKKNVKKPQPLYEEWIAALSHIYIKIFNGYANNKPRLRRVLFNSIANLGLAEQRAEMIDITWLNIDVNNSVELKKKELSFSFTLYMTDFIIDVMHQVLLLGFDLDIYHHTEFSQIAWYIDYLTRLRTLGFQRLHDTKKKKVPVANLSRYQVYIKVLTEIHNLFYRGLFRVS